MLGRCRNPRIKQWADYGGRGIQVCERWQSYKHFAEDMGPRPPGTMLDRIDNDGPYSPDNCRWATHKEQQRNQRRTRRVIVEGVEYLAVELAERAGIKTDNIVVRAAAGLSLAEVLSPTRRTSAAGIPQAIAARIANSRTRTHCKNGHAFTPENTRFTKEGWRCCRSCYKALVRRRNATAYAKRTQGRMLI